MNFELNKKIDQIAKQFGFDKITSVKPIEEGLINKTFLVDTVNRSPILIQQINSNVFKSPEDVQHNYQLIYEHLKKKNFFIPRLVKTISNELLWKGEEKNYWRAFEYINNSFSINSVSNINEAKGVAACFGNFASLFKDFSAEKLKTVIPDFHNLSFRYQQFKEALHTTKLKINNELNDLITELQSKKFLVSAYESFLNEKQFPLHVMHHDCKINNILFDKKSGEVICPIDMDTVMPGKFFSDVGDMIRTISCSKDENSIEWDSITIKKDYYKAITEEYLTSTNNLFTHEEKQNIHYSGLILIYMQALRFLADYLNGNIYYKINYPEQNFHRAKNQILLLKSLEELLSENYNLVFPEK